MLVTHWLEITIGREMRYLICIEHGVHYTTIIGEKYGTNLAYKIILIKNIKVKHIKFYGREGT
jgi:hypothetical protein